MSLNWREIDKVLSELPLAGLSLQRIRQPDYSRLILEFSGKGLFLNLGIVLTTPFIRLHRIDGPLPPALPRPPRFNAVVKSRLEGSRLNSVRQLGNNRIVRFTFGSNDKTLYLDAKLWGGAANLILFDEDSLIIDTFTRRPGRGEIPGVRWDPEPTLRPPEPGPGISPKQYTIRSLPGTPDSDFNTKIAAHYAQLERLARTRNNIELWRAYLTRRKNSLIQRRNHTKSHLASFEKQLNHRHWGDIILSGLHEIQNSASSYQTEDWESPGTVLTIPLDPALSPRENARRYYERGRRAERGIRRLQDDLSDITTALNEVDRLTEQLEKADTDTPPFNGPPPKPPKKAATGSSGIGGLQITRPPFLILVGRNAKESDHILRHWAKGNDYWMHTRDYPGGHVFIRPPKGKNVPLDILLDAGNLALAYSKAPSNQAADMYYTQVKYLRRPKDGKTGTVLPTKEKNIRISKDTRRLASLKKAAEIV